LRHIVENPSLLADWRRLLSLEYLNPAMMIGAALLVFPKLALGLSGFETGVVVMPLVKGDPGDTAANPAGRIRNTRKLLTTAALIMSVMLICSSMVTTLLIPAPLFQPGGEASGRALAYLAHEQLGDLFGTLYDISTILILWFAGASAMAGLLNLVPRDLPRYGMAPDWTRATRPLVLVFTAVCFIVTIVFRADVLSQAGAYATGVLALITSATVAVTLSAHRRGEHRATIWYGIVSLIFIYTTVVTVRTNPSGIKIAGLFIASIVILSLVSRVMRSTELRTTEVMFDDDAQRFIDAAGQSGPVRLIANHPDDRTSREYLLKEREEREASHIPAGDPVLFLEVTVRDASEFTATVMVDGEEIEGFRVLKAEASSVPNAIAAVLLAIRDRTGKRPHAYFGWTAGNPLKYLTRFVLFGEGDIAPVTREVLRQAEPDPGKRPAVHVG
ncbi:MAG: amino acid transporter, partial [Chloroflexota bacterium]